MFVDKGNFIYFRGWCKWYPSRWYWIYSGWSTMCNHSNIPDVLIKIFLEYNCVYISCGPKNYYTHCSNHGGLRYYSHYVIPSESCKGSFHTQDRKPMTIHSKKYDLLKRPRPSKFTPNRRRRLNNLNFLSWM